VELLFRLNEEVKKYIHDRRDRKTSSPHRSPVL
jgi:hypothetical protein